jgi:hypothetical protein
MPKRKPGVGTKPKLVPTRRYPSGDPVPDERGKAPTLVKRIMDHAEKMGRELRLQGIISGWTLAWRPSSANCGYRALSPAGPNDE